jgi:hypothetical protein
MIRTMAARVAAFFIVVVAAAAWAAIIAAAVAGVVATLTIATSPAPGFDSQKWGDDAVTREWFRSLRSAVGIPCCDYADGVRIEDPDWRENEDGSYSVFARGGWQRIEKNQLVPGRNRIGYAILWWPEHWDHPSCFLPGARG